MLQPTSVTGEVAFLGVNRDRRAGLESAPQERVAARFAGFEGEAHGGLTRGACVRVAKQYPKGTEIRNVRQLTIVSIEELAEVAAAMTLSGALSPAWIGANMALRGVPRLTELPSGARLIFENGTGIAVDMENGPCRYAGEAIDAHEPGRGLSFVKHARGKRGVAAWVEREGEIALGDRCVLHVPPQRPYRTG